MRGVWLCVRLVSVMVDQSTFRVRRRSDPCPFVYSDKPMSESLTASSKLGPGTVISPLFPVLGHSTLGGGSIGDRDGIDEGLATLDRDPRPHLSRDASCGHSTGTNPRKDDFEYGTMVTPDTEDEALIQPP